MEYREDIADLVTAASGQDGTQSSVALDRLAALAANSLRYELAAKNLQDVVFYETGGGREYVSDSLVRILGYPPEKFTEDRHFFVSLMNDEDTPRTSKQIADWHAAGEPGMLVLEFRARHADGSWVWFEDRMVMIRPEGNARPYMFGVLIDTTLRKTAELGLIEAERKMAGTKALLATARTFAHHINSPLTGILGNCQILSEELKGREELQELISEIKTGARRIGEITQKLLAESELKFIKYTETSEIIEV